MRVSEPIFKKCVKQEVCKLLKNSKVIFKADRVNPKGVEQILDLANSKNGAMFYKNVVQEVLRRCLTIDRRPGRPRATPGYCSGQ